MEDSNALLDLRYEGIDNFFANDTMTSTDRLIHMARVSILLIIVVLIAGIVGCVGGNGNGGDSYILIIDMMVGGSVTVDNLPLPGKAILNYDAGTVVSLNAIPDDDYRFVEWTGNATTIDDENAASTTITVNDDYYITANFIAQYVLMIESTNGGEVITPGEGMFNYDAGTVVDLVTEAKEGYKLLNWTGDVDTIADVNAASTTISMEGDCVVTANFIEENIYLDVIGPSLWSVGVWGQGVNATVTEEGIVVNIASNPVNELQAEQQPAFGAGGQTTYLLQGDFDIRMDYELTTWPQESGVRVGMSVGIPDIPGVSMYDMSINIERTSLGAPDFPHISFREVYLVNARFEQDNIVGITSTDDLSGTLRIRREGAIVSCYYRTSDGWQKLYEKEWSTENVYAWISTWSREFMFGGEEVSVLLCTVEIIEPST